MDCAIPKRSHFCHQVVSNCKKLWIENKIKRLLATAGSSSHQDTRQVMYYVQDVPLNVQTKHSRCLNRSSLSKFAERSSKTSTFILFLHFGADIEKIITSFECVPVRRYMVPVSILCILQYWDQWHVFKPNIA